MRYTKKEKKANPDYAPSPLSPFIRKKNTGINGFLKLIAFVFLS
jgi:hypothetical protein